MPREVYYILYIPSLVHYISSSSTPQILMGIPEKN